MFKSRIRSFKFALNGVRDLFSTEANARIHLLVALLVVIAGFYLQISTTEWCFVVFAITSVLAAEAFNSAIEYLTDLASPNFHPLAGKAKDIAAAAVLFTAIGAAIIGLCVFGPKFLRLIN